MLDAIESVVDSVLPPRLEREVVWHYTSPDTARRIVEGHAFWATSVESMNDRSELLYGMDLVKHEWKARSAHSDHWERIDEWIFFAELVLRGERLSDSYVLCASTKQDSLPQWDRYGSCELGITERLMTKQARPDSEGGRLGATFTTGWRPVIYKPDQQCHHVLRLISVLEDLCSREIWHRGDAPRTLDATGIECVLRAIVYLKDSAYAEEHEVRLYGQANATGALVETHDGKFGPSRHILVYASDSFDDDSLPIVKIRLADVNSRTEHEAQLLREILRLDAPAVALTVVKTSLRMA